MIMSLFSHAQANFDEVLDPSFTEQPYPNLELINRANGLLENICGQILELSVCEESYAKGKFVVNGTDWRSIPEILRDI